METEPDYANGATGDGWGGLPFFNSSPETPTYDKGKKIQSDNLSNAARQIRTDSRLSNARDQSAFEKGYLPMLSQAYIYVKNGGLPNEVFVRTSNGELWVDNIDARGRLHEAKTSIVDDGTQNVHQLRGYARFLDENRNVVLVDDFFANPGRSTYGPTAPFATRLAMESVIHDICFEIHPEGWWDDLQ